VDRISEIASRMRKLPPLSSLRFLCVSARDVPATGPLANTSSAQRRRDAEKAAQKRWPRCNSSHSASNSTDTAH
jgi:hypothetical protein